MVSTSTDSVFKHLLMDIEIRVAAEVVVVVLFRQINASHLFEFIIYSEANEIFDLTYR